MIIQVIPMPAKTLSWWRDEKDDIDFEPIYQRKGHVWSRVQKQYLIDSILNGFDVPKIYVADFTFLNSSLNTHRKKYAVIDGKQRLLAIYDFYNGDVRLPKDFVYAEDPSLRLAGMTYQKIAAKYPKIARRFDNYNLTVMSVITNDESKINDLFVRLNSSKPLTGSELRNAMTGAVPDLVRQLVEHPFFRSNVKFNTARSQDKNTAAKLLLLEHRGAIVDTKKAQLDALVEETNKPAQAESVNYDEVELAEEDFLETVVVTENPDVRRSAERVLTVLDHLSTVFSEKDDLLSQQAHIVVVYWLAREIPLEQAPKLREFLAAFEEARRVNRDAPQGSKDTELDEFELMARTSNDSSSIKYRFGVLRSRFEEFCQGH